MICQICGEAIGDTGPQFFRDCPKCGTVHVTCDPCIDGQVHTDRVKIHDGRE